VNQPLREVEGAGTCSRPGFSFVHRTLSKLNRRLAVRPRAPVARRRGGLLGLAATAADLRRSIREVLNVPEAFRPLAEHAALQLTSSGLAVYPWTSAFRCGMAMSPRSPQPARTVPLCPMPVRGMRRAISRTDFCSWANRSTMSVRGRRSLLSRSPDTSSTSRRLPADST
jgi:hypothetical protein